MKNTIEKWRESGKHLPLFMRDFHDQKELFKYMHDKQDCNSISTITSMNGHIYIIDCFLWFMAKRGYTLQKTKTRLDFNDIEKELQEYRIRKNKIFFN